MHAGLRRPDRMRVISGLRPAVYAGTTDLEGEHASMYRKKLDGRQIRAIRHLKQWWGAARFLANPELAAISTADARKQPAAQRAKQNMETGGVGCGKA
jgi:hypothetical protein